MWLNVCISAQTPKVQKVPKVFFAEGCRHKRPGTFNYQLCEHQGQTGLLGSERLPPQWVWPLACSLAAAPGCYWIAFKLAQPTPFQRCRLLLGFHKSHRQASDLAETAELGWNAEQTAVLCASPVTGSPSSCVNVAKIHLKIKFLIVYSVLCSL